MTFEEAINHVEYGGKATCDLLQKGACLKLQDGIIRVVFEATGSGYSFGFQDEYKLAEWRTLDGWKRYY